MVKTPEGRIVKEAIDRDDLIGHGQVIRSVYNKAKGIHKKGGRAVGLLKDVADTVRGKPRERDPWGRKKKKEWEKPWFKNAAGATAITVGTLAALKNRKIAHAVGKGSKWLAKTANSIIPDAVPHEYSALDRLRNLIEFDETAPNWDIRHQRGNSARVFAQYHKPRERREKEVVRAP